MKKLIFISLLISNICLASDWECISKTFSCNTWRMKVPSGWIVAGDSTTTYDAYAMTFVPDPNHEWKI